MSKKKTILFVFWLSMPFFTSFAQVSEVSTLSFEEFLGFVKKYHPVAKQAQLKISAGQATLLQARGGFDPKIAVDYDQKRFKGDEYFELLNTTFKIPTWFGIELKGAFEQNEGVFLNPQNNVPENGLYSAGISLPLGQGLLINNRMAALKQAKIFQQLSLAERDLEVNNILYESAIAYFEWYIAYQNWQLSQNFYANAQERYIGIKQRAVSGDLPAIDTLEAGIVVQNRFLSMEQARLDHVKAKLDLSNFLWIENNIPLEVNEGIAPEAIVPESIDRLLGTDLLRTFQENLANHPKILALNYKIEALETERRLKADKLKPKIDFEYNFLTQNAEDFDAYFAGDYKTTVRFSLPLFLRKERGELRLSKLKVQDAELDAAYQQLTLENKINAGIAEMNSYREQLVMYDGLVTGYEKLLTAEERKFDLGESSIFLLNSRESALIDSRGKENLALKKLLISKATLFKTLANEVDLP
ncbi:MAG: TolC family protein [Bacteroidetes bacterium]|nr:TolC family protein [Bacteroidota bacterium]